MLERHNDIDFYWLDGKPEPSEDATLLVGLQGEQGHAGFLTIMSCVGEAEPIAYLCSRLHSVEAFNTIPEPMHPGWILYRIKNKVDKVVYVLRVTNWFPLQARPDANPHAWLYSYSVVRDTLDGLIGLGVNNFTLLTTTTIQQYTNDAAFLDINQKEYVTYDFTEDSELQKDLMMNQPCWVFPYLFSLMTNEPSVVVCAAHDKSNPNIDKDAQYALSKYCGYYLDLEMDDEEAQKIENVLLELHDEMEAGSDEVRYNMARETGVKINNDTGVMWQ